MGNLEDQMRDLLKKTECAESQEKVEKLICEFIPQIDKVQAKFFSKNDALERTEVNWIQDLAEYLTASIKLYMNYHITGTLSEIVLDISEKEPPKVSLKVSGRCCRIDFDDYAHCADLPQREAHRECANRHESIWNEFRQDKPGLTLDFIGKVLCQKLQKSFPKIKITYHFDG